MEGSTPRLTRKWKWHQLSGRDVYLETLLGATKVTSVLSPFICNLLQTIAQQPTPNFTNKCGWWKQLLGSMTGTAHQDATDWTHDTTSWTQDATGWTPDTNGWTQDGDLCITLARDYVCA